MTKNTEPSRRCRRRFLGISRPSSRAQPELSKREMVCNCLLCFDGKDVWEPYSTQLQVAAWHHCWTVAVTTMLHFSLCVCHGGQTAAAGEVKEKHHITNILIGINDAVDDGKTEGGGEERRPQ
ncbi:hypothetical protein SRHO_G00245720 [Serrasalmus rhombeus]